MEKGKKFWIAVIVVSLFILSLLMVVGNSSTKSKQLGEENVELEADLEVESAMVVTLETDIDEKEALIIELENKVAEAQPWFEMTEREKKDLEEKEE